MAPADAVLFRHDPDVPEWDSLSPDARRLAARMMEVYAGFLSHTDHQIRRLVEYLREIGELDNTLIMVVSDNGASAEGGVTGTTNEAQFFNNAPRAARGQPQGDRRPRRPGHVQPLSVGLELGRQHAVPALEEGDLPRRCQRSVPRPLAPRHQGTRRSAHRVRRPRRHGPHRPRCPRDRAARRRQGRHPVPLHGVSFAHTFDNATAPTTHRTQYFEMLGRRAIDHDGWRAVCPWPGPSFTGRAAQPFGTPITAEKLSELDADDWELYHITEDFAETRVVVADHRDKMIEMVSLWYVEAGKYNVLPIDGSTLARMMTGVRRSRRSARATPSVPIPRRCPRQWSPGCSTVPHSVTADVEIPPDGAEGVLISQGTRAAAGACTSRTASCTTSTTDVSRAFYTLSSADPVPQAATSCASSSNRQANPTSPPAKAHPAGPSSTSTAGEWRKPTSPRPRPSCSTPAG